MAENFCCIVSLVSWDWLSCWSVSITHHLYIFEVIKRINFLKTPLMNESDKLTRISERDLLGCCCPS
jgi:hypothetical protein